MTARVTMVVLVVLVLSGCASGTVAPVGTGGGLSAPTPVAGEEYRIVPYDTLEILVFQVKDLDRVAQVTSTGSIILPLIGEVRAAGTTSRELEAVLAKRYGEFLQKPRVSVTIKQASGQSITVDGAVLKPGVFPLNGSVSLSQAVALAGGLNDVASKNSVSLSRTTGSERTIQSYDLESIQTGRATDPMLIAGDIVVVQESGFKTTLRDTSRTLAPIAQGVGAIRVW